MVGHEPSRLGRARSRASLFLATSALAVSTVACNAPSENPNPWVDQNFSEAVAIAIEEAQLGGSGKPQIDLLLQAQAEGFVSAESARIAAHQVVDCFAEFGGEAVYTEETTESGLLLPGYQVGFDEDFGIENIDLWIDTCQAREFRWLNRLYQGQPSSRELVGAYVLSREEPLRVCLEREGTVTDDGADGWELAHIALDLLIATEFEIDCLYEANITGL